MVNFYYSLKVNNLNHLQQGFGQVGVGGGSLEKENQNIPSFYPSNLVRKENLAPLFQIFLIIPFDFPHEIYKCKKRNL